MFGFFKKKEIDLEDYLNKTKKIYINGVIFRIKKISLDDHLAGFNVLIKARDIYQKQENKTPESAIDLRKKTNKVLRDIIAAGVVKPELTLKKDEPDKIHVDEVLSDIDLADKLATAIFEYSYGKKK